MAQAHKFRKGKSLFSTTLATGISTGTSETITPNSVSGLPTDTEITLTIDRVNSAGTATPTLTERITGVISGGNLTSYTRGVDGTTEQAHSAGAVVEYIWNADDLNDLVDGLLVEHNQTGTHKAALVTTLKATGAEVATGTEDAKIVTPKAIADAGLNTRLLSKIITATRDMTASSGDVAYTGVGFQPTAVVCLGAIDGTINQSVGVADSSGAEKSDSQTYDTYSYDKTSLVTAITSLGNFQEAVLKQYDADGFTLTWTKGGAPGAGTLKMIFLCFR